MESLGLLLVPYLMLQTAIQKQLSQWGWGGGFTCGRIDTDFISCIVPACVSRPLAALLAVLLCFFTTSGWVMSSLPTRMEKCSISADL